MVKPYSFNVPLDSFIQMMPIYIERKQCSGFEVFGLHNIMLNASSVVNGNRCVNVVESLCLYFRVHAIQLLQVDMSCTVNNLLLNNMASTCDCCKDA